MIFFEFFFKILSAKTFDKVSTVLPDLEITMKRIFEKFSLFLNEKFYFHQDY